jgi:photosystem II stability/assembly factor-like uncharacterized protein
VSNTQYEIPNTFTHTGGWPGGTITSLLLLPGGDILAGTKAGLFRSIDAGQNWLRVVNGPADPAIVALAISGPDIFATSKGGRLYRSDDGGGMWPEVVGWAGLGVGIAIALSPAYADDATLFVATVDGPLRSQDRGNSWELSNFGLLDVDTLCLAISPNFASDESLWAGTAFGGFFRSRNAGRSWREAGAGLPDAAVQSLAQDADGTLYAGSESDGVFRSLDGGNSWQRAGDELTGLSVNTLAVLPDCLLAGTGSGVFCSTDRGESWQPCAGGDFVAFALTGADSLAVAGGWQSGAHISRDGGRFWQAANGDGADRLTGHAPPLAVLTPWNELFVVDGDGVAALSTDRGVTWQPLDFLPADSFCGLIASAGSGDSFTLFAWADDFFYRRTGQGEWEELPAPGDGAAQLAASPAFDTDGSLFLVDGDGYLYLSEDRGDSWQELSGPETEGDVLAVAISPFFAEDLRLYLVTAGYDGQAVQAEVWQSDDAGQSWTDLAGLSLDTPSLSILPLADELCRPLLLAAQNRLITLYTDPETGELTVEQRFLEADVRVISLATATDSANPTRLLAATNRGVWQITDRPGVADCIGLSEKSVVAIFPDGDSLCAITLGGGVWWG